MLRKANSILLILDSHDILCMTVKDHDEMFDAILVPKTLKINFA